MHLRHTKTESGGRDSKKTCLLLVCLIQRRCSCGILALESWTRAIRVAVSFPKEVPEEKKAAQRWHTSPLFVKSKDFTPRHAPRTHDSELHIHSPLMSDHIIFVLMIDGENHSIVQRAQCKCKEQGSDLIVAEAQAHNFFLSTFNEMRLSAFGEIRDPGSGASTPG